jgi:hypothetical protein
MKRGMKADVWARVCTVVIAAVENEVELLMIEPLAEKTPDSCVD